MRRRAGFRRAVAASVAAHALVVVIVAAVRSGADRPAAPPPPGIDTRVTVRTETPASDAEFPVEAPAPPAPRRPDPPPAAPAPSEDTRPPLVRSPAVPNALPPELLALMRKPAPPVPDPAVQPAAATGAPTLDGGAALHGAVGPGRAVVYVLDASGSMGEWGKFDAARRALAATLRAQPGVARFQVVVYAGGAVVPLPSAGGCLPATADNVARMTAALAALPPPAGRSDHAAGLRAALALRPDFVLVLTDADDLPAGVVRALLRQAARPAALSVAAVGPAGVAAPREWK